MKPINLPSLDRVNELLDYDLETGVFTWKIYRGGKAKAGTIAGNRRVDGYWQICIDNKNYKGQRLAWYMVTGNDPMELDVDHIDGDNTDNRFCKLRLANNSQNCSNRKRRSDNKSGYKGVYRMGNKWAAQITANKERIFLGIFDTPELAYEKYVSNAKAKHGEFARFA